MLATKCVLTVLFVHWAVLEGATPTITQLSHQSAYYGETFTISGSGFTSSAVASIGPGSENLICTETLYHSSTEVACVTPAGSVYNKHIYVTVESAVATSAKLFTYSHPFILSEDSNTTDANVDKAIHGIIPSNAYYGETVSILGWGFSMQGTVNNTAVTAMMDDTPCQGGGTWLSAWLMTCVVGVKDPGAYNVSVVVNNKYGSLANSFSYTSPTITSVTPSVSLPGEHITVFGTNFGSIWSNMYAPEFGGIACSDYTFDTGAGSVTCRLPDPPTASATGPQNVKVSVTNAVHDVSGYFSYATPAVTALEPAIALKGATVTLLGNRFGSSSAYFTPVAEIGNSECDSTSYISDTRAECVVPSGIGEGNSVKFRVKGAGEVVVDGNPFTYQLTVTRMEPLTGFVGNPTGPLLTIAGTNFDRTLNKTAAVTVDGEVCRELSFITTGNDALNMTLECIPPDGLLGDVNVIVYLGSQSAMAGETLHYPDKLDQWTDKGTWALVLSCLSMIVAGICNVLTASPGFSPAIVSIIHYMQFLALVHTIDSTPRRLWRATIPFSQAALQEAPVHVFAEDHEEYISLEWMKNLIPNYVEETLMWALLLVVMLCSTLVLLGIARVVCCVPCCSRYCRVLRWRLEHDPDVIRFPVVETLVWLLAAPSLCLLASSVLVQRLSIYALFSIFLIATVYISAFGMAMSVLVNTLDGTVVFDFDDDIQRMHLRALHQRYVSARKRKRACVGPCLLLNDGYTLTVLERIWEWMCQPEGFWSEKTMDMGSFSLTVSNFAPRGRLGRSVYFVVHVTPFIIGGLGVDILTLLVIILSATISTVYTMWNRPALIPLHNHIETVSGLSRIILTIFIFVFRVGISNTSEEGNLIDTFAVYFAFFTLFILSLGVSRDIAYFAYIAMCRRLNFKREGHRSEEQEHEDELKTAEMSTLHTVHSSSALRILDAVKTSSQYKLPMGEGSLDEWADEWVDDASASNLDVSELVWDMVENALTVTPSSADRRRNQSLPAPWRADDPPAAFDRMGTMSVDHDEDDRNILLAAKADSRKKIVSYPR